MSMKTKKNRWAAIVVAALAIAGGTVAVPQAASAATITCGWDGYGCTLITSASGTVSFRAYDSWGTKYSSRYTVRTKSGSLICSGSLTVNGGWKTCSLFGYKGEVQIRVTKAWEKGMRIVTS